MDGAILYVVGDPGLPPGAVDDPFAGLVEQDAVDLTRAVLENCADDIPYEVWVEWLVRDDNDLEHFDAWLAEHHPELAEGKAVGTANLGGNLARRDRQLKRQSTGNVRYHVTQAARNVRRDLSAIEGKAKRDIESTISGWIEGNVSFREVQDQTSFMWRKAYEQVHEVGRRASGVHRMHPDPKVVSEEEKWFRSALREELRYWHLALDEWRRRRNEAARSGANAVAKVDAAGFRRFESYLKSLDSMYDGARALALPPGVLAYWLGPDPSDDDAVCDGCAYMVERSPFPKALLPATPRSGMTPCLHNCRHKLVLRAATSADIARRMTALPGRQTMLGDLRRIKTAHHGTDRQQRARAHAKRTRGAGRSHVHNPFHRTPLGLMGQELPP
jgi:hypothetical protein